MTNVVYSSVARGLSGSAAFTKMKRTLQAGDFWEGARSVTAKRKSEFSGIGKESEG